MPTRTGVRADTVARVGSLRLASQGLRGAPDRLTPAFPHPARAGLTEALEAEGFSASGHSPHLARRRPSARGRRHCLRPESPADVGRASRPLDTHPAGHSPEQTQLDPAPEAKVLRDPDVAPTIVTDVDALNPLPVSRPRGSAKQVDASTKTKDAMRLFGVDGHFQGELGGADVGRYLDRVLAVEAGPAELVFVDADGLGDPVQA